MRPVVVIYALDQDSRLTSSPGIFNTLRNMILAMSMMPDPGFDIVVLVSDANAGSLIPLSLPAWMRPRIVAGNYSTGWRRLWADHVLSVLLATKERAFVVYFPKGFLPIYCPCRFRSVVLINDAIVDYYAENFPGFISPLKVRYFKWATRLSLRHAARVLTISWFSRKELSKLVPKSTRNIEVIPLGPGLPVDVDKGLQPITKNSILVLGSRFPHKFTVGTLQLLAKYAESRSVQIDVIVTGLHDAPSCFTNNTRLLSVKYVGRVSDAKMSQLLRESKALVLLSTVEGFGLPLLESYAHGTPVCFRSDSSLFEIMNGEFGGWDGESSDSFCSALDVTLAATPQMIKGAWMRLNEKYSWEHAATHVFKIFADELGMSMEIPVSRVNGE